MKFLSLVLSAALLMAVSDAFSVPRQEQQQGHTVALNAMDRRAMITTAAFTGSVLLIPTVAFAGENYVPQLKDMQQIYCE